MQNGRCFHEFWPGRVPNHASWVCFTKEQWYNPFFSMAAKLGVSPCRNMIFSICFMTVAQKISGLWFWYHLETDSWERPSANAALEATGLFLMITYLRLCREYIMSYVKSLQVFEQLQQRTLTAETAAKWFYVDDLELVRLEQQIVPTGAKRLIVMWEDTVRRNPEVVVRVWELMRMNG